MTVALRYNRPLHWHLWHVFMSANEHNSRLWQTKENKSGMSEQKPSTPQAANEPPRSPYGYNERNIHSETTEIGEFTDTLNSDRVKLESSFFSVKHRWQTGADGKGDVRRTTTDINNFGISIITLTSDREVLIYHDGRTYKPVNQYWIDNIADDLKRGTLPAYLPNALALTDFSTHPLGNYIIDHWRTLGDGHNIITYCRCSQLGKVADIISRYPFAFRHYRITRQQHLTAFGAPVDGTSMLMYNGLFCKYEHRDGMTEIVGSGVFDEDMHACGDAGQCRDIELDNSTAFFQFVSGAMRLLFSKSSSPFNFHVSDVLLDAFPSAFGMCKAHPESHIRLSGVMMPAFTSIPCKVSDTIVLEESDEVFVGTDGDLRPLDLRRLFGHQPRTVTLTVDMDANLRTYIIAKDEDTGQQEATEYIYLRRAQQSMLG